MRKYHINSFIWIITMISYSSLFATSNHSNILEITNANPAQDKNISCDSILVNDIFQEWIEDMGGFEVDDFCPGITGFAAVPGSYDITDFNTFPGESVGKLDTIICPSPIAGVLRTELVDFVFYDECDNVMVSTARFSIIDTVGPTILNCPGDVGYTIGDNSCELSVTLKRPKINDDCGSDASQFENQITQNITAANPDVNTIVDSMTFSFGPIDVSTSAVESDATLTISLSSVDANLETEFFTIVGENNTFLGITPKTNQECGDSTISINISKNQINTWAQDGYIEIHLYPKILTDPVLAVNDICGGSTITANISFDVSVSNIITYAIQINEGAIFPSTDSVGHDTILPVGIYNIKYIFEDCAQNISFCSSKLTISETISPEILCPNDTNITMLPSFCIQEYRMPNEIPFTDNCDTVHNNLQFSVSGATDIGLKTYAITDSIINLNVGINTIQFISNDISDNADTCSYLVNIKDEELPMIECKNDTLLLDIYQQAFIVLDTQLLGAIISDNCGIDSIVISPDTIFCDNNGSDITINISVWDINGNQNNCNANYFIETTELAPSYIPIPCEGDSLALLSNLTATNPNLNYEWEGPNNFTSDQANPVIYNLTNAASGIYIFSISDAGCSMQDSIEIIFEILIQPEIFNDTTTICEGDSVVIFATSYQYDVNYNWYQGEGTNQVLVATTNVNHLEIQPSVGTYTYSVKVSNENCITDISPPHTLEVIVKPEANILSMMDEVCEEDIIYLTSDIPSSNLFNYTWLGPNDYISTKRNSTIENAQLIHDGLYKFSVSRGFCSSDTTSKMVSVNIRPDKPTISSAGVFCEGSDVLLTIENNVGEEFFWIKDGNSFAVTTTNELVIPNADASYNGNWNVQIRLGDCYSDTSFSHEIVIEEYIELGISGPDKACIGDSIQFNAPFISNATYLWSGPSDFSSDDQNPKLIAVGGEYQLQVITAIGCMNVTSLLLEVEAMPNISAITVDADICMDGTSPIVLSASIFPTNEYNYHWTGPNNYESSDVSPSIPNADSTLNGYYVLSIENDYCSSSLDSILVDIYNIPSQPVLNIENEYCFGSDISIPINNHPGEAYEYVWNTPIGQTITDLPILEISDLSMSHTGNYSVIVQNGPCLSEPSESVEVILRTLPPTPTINGDNFVCEGDSIRLSANDLSLDGYEWMGPNGFVSSGLSILLEDFSTTQNGAYFVRRYDGHCYSEWSVPRVLNMLPKPNPAAISTISDAVCIGQSDTINICLEQNSTSNGASYHVYESNTNNLLGSSSDNCFDINNTDGLLAGNNTLYLLTELNSCTSRNPLEVNIQGDEIPGEPAFINEGEELHLCFDETIFLSTNPDSITLLRWYSQGNNTFSPNNQDQTMVDNLEDGNNVIYLSYSYKSCDDYSLDSIDLILEEEPIGFDDNINTDYNESILIDVIENDELFGEIFIKLDSAQEIQGTISIIDNKVEYTPDPDFIGEVSFEYEICNLYCDDMCSIATIYANVGKENDCFATNIITPNSDDINDYFTVPCLNSEAYPSHKLSIINQWGNIVFQSKNYKNDWSGTYNGNELPSGTYYYLLDLGNESDIIKGFLVIER